MFLPKIYIAQKLWSCYSIGTTEIWPGACYLLAAWWQNLRPVITYCRSYGFRRHNAVPPKGSFNNYVDQILPNFNPLPLSSNLNDPLVEYVPWIIWRPQKQRSENLKKQFFLASKIVLISVLTRLAFKMGQISAQSLFYFSVVSIRVQVA